MKLIIPVPPYADFRKVAKDNVVEAVRLNTTHELSDPLEDCLLQIKSYAAPKPVWLDLKCRQLRIVKYNVELLRAKEIHHIELIHNLKVNTPTVVYIDDGNFSGNIERIVNDNTIVVTSSTERKEGFPLPGQGEIGIRPGMSINIPDKSLDIEGNLTNKDIRIIKA